MNKKLTPFKLCVLQNFPFIEEDFDALTNYELLCKVVEYLNKTIDSQNNVIEQINNLNNWFNNLNVQDEINNKLDKMVEDGTLSEIINQEIFGELNEKINNAMLKTDNQHFSKLSLKRKLRYFVQNGNHPEHVSGQDYPTLQGGTYTGNEKMIIVKNRQNDDNELQEISLIDGSVIRSAKMSLGHGNSVTFNPTTNKVYITGLIGENNHKLYVIDYLSFTLESTLVFNQLEENEGTLAVSYDLVKDKYYLITETGETHYQRIYEMNIITQELAIIDLVDFDNVLSYTNTNDCMVYDNVLYVLKYNPMLLATFDLRTKKLLNIYNIDNTIEQGTPVGELESISIKYDTEYKNLLLASNRLECLNGFYNMFQYYETNLSNNISENIMINQYGLNRYIQVDINSTSINPTGTESQPYKHLSEAIETLNSIKGSAIIQVKAGTYPYVFINGINKNTGIGITSGNFTIQGLQLRNSSGLYIFNATINNLSSNQNVDVYLEYSKIRFANITLNNTGDVNMYIHNSSIEITNVPNLILNCASQNNIICYDNIPSYKVKTGVLPNMNKPVKLCNGNYSATSDSTTYDLSDNVVLLKATRVVLQAHSHYGYFDVEIPNLTSDGNRIFSALLNKWLVDFSLIRNGNTLALKVNSSRVVDTGVVDNTASATGDFVLYAKN